MRVPSIPKTPKSRQERSATREKTSRRNPPRTVGPVSDLERHLPTEWWRGLFNSLYLKTDGDVVENDVNTIQDVDLLLAASGLGPDDRILDLCCGQGRHVLELARRGFRNLHGVDRSRYLVRLARRRASEQKLAIDLREGDARRFQTKEGAFDAVIMMGNSFGYFDRQEDDNVVLTRVRRALASHGMLVLDVADGAWLRDHFERRSWEWIDADHFVCRERSLSSDGQRLISREVVVHSERGVIADQFYAERLYDRATFETILGEAGFHEIQFHDPVEVLSTRGQDLGMLSRRLFVTSRAPIKATRKRRANRDVAVLLGDPRRPDTVKKDGHFNPEDMDTVKRLKDALNQVEGYAFTYLDDHATLRRDLEKNPPDLALNFCDEGFNNDAFQELHVPAYLEILGIPYTGAGPASLGLCYDKGHVRSIAQNLDVPVPLETYFDPDDQAATLPSVLPALIKPNQGDSSIGITQKAVVRTPSELVAYLDFLKGILPGRAVLLQEYLDGPEYSVGLIGNPGADIQALPVLEVDYSRLPKDLPPILPYESKWDPSSPYWTDIAYKEADLDDGVRRELVDRSVLLFERLGCRDYARFDFRADASGTIKLLEANPNPGWCWDGKLNLMAGFRGMSYAEVLAGILAAAEHRIEATGVASKCALARAG